MQRVETAQDDGTVEHGPESVLIRVPAHRDYIVVIRSALAQLGARLGYTVAEIIDLRLAVDETCCLLVGDDRPLSDPPVGELECRVWVGSDVLEITVLGYGLGVGTPDREGFGWQVLTALVDSMTWVQDGPDTRVELVKRHSHGSVGDFLL